MEFRCGCSSTCLTIFLLMSVAQRRKKFASMHICVYHTGTQNPELTLKVWLHASARFIMLFRCSTLWEKLTRSISKDGGVAWCARHHCASSAKPFFLSNLCHSSLYKYALLVLCTCVWLTHHSLSHRCFTLIAHGCLAGAWAKSINYMFMYIDLRD